MRPANSPETSPRATPEISVRAPLLLRYASVVGSVVLAALLRLSLRPMLGSKAAFITLFPAIVYSAWVAGFGGGLLATTLCVLVAAWLIISPAASPLVADSSDQFSLFVFALIGLAISVLGHVQHQAQRRAEDSARAAAQSAAVLRESEKGLRESEAHKGAILEAAIDSIVNIDEQGTVIEWNPAAESMFGYSRTDALGHLLHTLIIPRPLHDAHLRGIAHYLKTGDGPVLNRRIEVTALHADGREFPVELTIVPIVLESRTLFAAYLRDLTERERNAAQQRAFLRDVLLSVTEGKLRLCHLPSELPAILASCGAPFPISQTVGIAELRAQARQAAAGHGFADERWQDLATAASEAAMNAAVHGGGGQGRVCASENTVQVWVEDKGAGIDMKNLPQATLEKGFSSVGTLGHGMKMMLSTADRVWLLTGSTGTTVVLEQDRLPPVARGLETTL